jgi:hypothetical protein
MRCMSHSSAHCHYFFELFPTKTQQVAQSPIFLIVDFLHLALNLIIIRQMATVRFTFIVAYHTFHAF